MTADPTIDPADDPAAIRERALSTAVEAKRALSALGGDYMTSQAARTAAKDLGMRGWTFYFGGRAGVLGSVEPEVVHAIVGFFPAEHVVASWTVARDPRQSRSEEHTSELQSRLHLVCRLLLEKKKQYIKCD